jgi:DNA-binding NarL/FixJ family response regulator
MESKTILVADSDVRFRSILTTTLEMMFGITRVIRADSLDAAVDSIQRYQPETVLLSYDLLSDCPPGYYEILKMQYLQKTLVILTDCNEISSVDSGIMAIADNIISKKELSRQFSFIPGAVLFTMIDRSRGNSGGRAIDNAI